MPLPRLMVAPNGARKVKKDHPAVPLSTAELVDTSKACFKAGADGLHLHIRTAKGRHLLDAAVYRHTLDAIKQEVPKLTLQITTEAVGIYQPTEQRDVVLQVKPEHASVSLAELQRDPNQEKNRQFYHQCKDQGTAIQHILYGPKDCEKLVQLIEQGVIPDHPLLLLFVLGRYSQAQQSTPNDLTPFTDWLSKTGLPADWAVCAFGSQETECLKAAWKAGGKVRVGFENSIYNSDGSIANNNQERVAEVARSIQLTARSNI